MSRLGAGFGWSARGGGLIKAGKLTGVKKTIAVGVMGKRESQAKAREFMSAINRANTSSLLRSTWAYFLNEYATMHIDRLAASTRGEYKSHIQEPH